MKSSTKKCSLSLEDFQEKISESLNNLRKDQDFCDVTLVCEDNKQIKAHKVVLSSSSYLLKNMLKTVTHIHPLLYFWDIKERDLLKIVDFIYTGQVEIYQSDLDEFLRISAKLEIQGIADNKICKEGMLETDIFIDKTKKDLQTTLSSTQTQNWEEFESDLSYQKGVLEALPPMIPVENHDLSLTEELGFETQQTKIIQNHGHKRRGPIWNYFLEDKVDQSFVFCTTCHKRLSRGKTGNPASTFYIGSMRHHLKTHQEIWKDYVELKGSDQTKDVPKNYEEINEPVVKSTQYRAVQEDSLGQIGDFFEKDSTIDLDEDNKNIKVLVLTTKGGKRRGPIWNFFKGDIVDITSVTCNICNSRISRGRSGASHGSLTSSSMITHLKNHPMEFGLYKDSKLEQRKSSQNPGVFPTQSKIRNPLQIEILNSTEEAEDKAWIFFDKDESSPRGLLCQVASAPSNSPKTVSGPGV